MTEAEPQADRTSTSNLDLSAGASTGEILNSLTKPPGSLGQLEEIAIHLSQITRQSPPVVPVNSAVAIFAGDHGVVENGVTPWPSEVTYQMVLNFLSGGAAINVFARHVGAKVVVVDVGVKGNFDELPGLIRAKVTPGTSNLALVDAMTLMQTKQAIDVGHNTACDLIDQGAQILATGDMGIGNTTPSAALTAALCNRSVDEVTGRGTGIDDEHFARKKQAIGEALARTSQKTEPLEILSSLGGLEIAAICGFIIAAAEKRTPVVIDGVISLAGALAADAIKPGTRDFMFGGHRSSEPAATIALDYLGLRPILDLEMRLGEGTGACLAISLIQVAAKITQEMATFDSAGVKDASQ